MSPHSLRGGSAFVVTSMHGSPKPLVAAVGLLCRHGRLLARHPQEGHSGCSRGPQVLGVQKVGVPWIWQLRSWCETVTV